MTVLVSVLSIIPLFCAMFTGLLLLAAGIYLVFVSKKRLAGGLTLAVGGLLTVLPIMFFLFTVVVARSRM